MKLEKYVSMCVESVMKYCYLLLLLVNITFAQDTTYSKGTTVLCESTSPADGKCVIQTGVMYITDSLTVNEIPYKDGVIHGMNKIYYNNKLVMSQMYAGGKRSGIAFRPYNKRKYGWIGKAKLIPNNASCTDNIKNGLCIQVNERGDTTSITKYKNGTPTGIQGTFDGNAIFIRPVNIPSRKFTINTDQYIGGNIYVDSITAMYNDNGQLISEMGLYGDQEVIQWYSYDTGKMRVESIDITSITSALYYKKFMLRTDGSYEVYDYIKCKITKYTDIYRREITSVSKLITNMSKVCPE